MVKWLVLKSSKRSQLLDKLWVKFSVISNQSNQVEVSTCIIVLISHVNTENFYQDRSTLAVLHCNRNFNWKFWERCISIFWRILFLNAQDLFVGDRMKLWKISKIENIQSTLLWLRGQHHINLLTFNILYYCDSLTSSTLLTF